MTEDGGGRLDSIDFQPARPRPIKHVVSVDSCGTYAQLASWDLHEPPPKCILIFFFNSLAYAWDLALRQGLGKFHLFVRSDQVSIWEKASLEVLHVSVHASVEIHGLAPVFDAGITPAAVYTWIGTSTTSLKQANWRVCDLQLTLGGKTMAI